MGKVRESLREVFLRMRLRPAVLLASVLSWSAWGQDYTISTFVGGGLPVNIPGTSASLGPNVPQYIAADRAGNLFFVDQSTVLRLDAATGIPTLVAGNGTIGFSGDNGPATSAQLGGPRGLAVDSAGNVYIADSYANRVRKVSNGVITTVAGNGTPGFSGDNGPATSAQLAQPFGLAVDSAGNLYIADHGNDRIRKVSNGVITTVAGAAANGTCCFNGDNGPATSAQIGSPEGIAVDSAGNLYFPDHFHDSIRKVSDGVITTVAGNGTFDFGGDNGPATGAALAGPYTVAVDSAGNLYIADAVVNRVRKVSGGIITTVAGNGLPGFSGDNGPATNAQLSYPYGVSVDSGGNLYIADSNNYRIRKVSNGVITTAAGNGTQGFGGDNGPAASAQLQPWGVAVDSSGSLYVADSPNHRIRKISNGVITTVAGNGMPGFSGDNGPATSAQLYYPYGVAVDASSNVYIADTFNYRIRKVSGGVITTVAGNGTQGFGRDTGPATNSPLYYPWGVAVDSAGNLYIADTDNQRIRKVANGVIGTVAGDGPSPGDYLSFPQGVAVDSAGNLYIADTKNNRIRKLSNGATTTVAGNGTGGFSGDNGPATSAQLAYPTGVAVDSAGSLYIADSANTRIRKVSNGAIITVAGNGTFGYSGDNGPATGAQLYTPYGVAVDSAGNVYVADYANGRVRVLTPTGPPCTYSVSPTALQAPASGGSLTLGIQTAASCTWGVSGLPGWMTVSGASSGANSASVPLAVFPNNTGAPLSATILVAGISVTITQPAAATAPLPPLKSVVNAASYIGGTVSPGEMVTLWGTGIGPATPAYATTDPATGKLATTIGGLQVLFNGIAAPMIYAGSTQISAVAPYEMAPAASPGVWIKYAGQTSNAFQLTSAATAPGLFTQNSSGSGPGSILNQDYSMNGPGHPAAKGSIVMVYLTGEGQTNPPGVTGAITTATLPAPQVTPAPLLAIGVTINGQPAFCTYAGEAPGLVAGMMQLNVQIPSNAPSGNLPITVSIGGNTSQNGVTVSVE
jgi:uncharacterized protein (TIGR03437 family)